MIDFLIRLSTQEFIQHNDNLIKRRINHVGVVQKPLLIGFCDCCVLHRLVDATVQTNMISAEVCVPFHLTAKSKLTLN